MKIKIGKIFIELYKRKTIEMIAEESCTDHMLIGISPKYTVSKIVEYLKGKSFHYF